LNNTSLIPVLTLNFKLMLKRLLKKCASHLIPFS
jgi:hypothetical protein